MGLKDRLRALQQQAGTTTSEPAIAEAGDAEAVATSLQERLARLRVPSTSAAEQPRPAGDASVLADSLGASMPAPGVLRVDHYLEPGAMHGRQPLPSPRQTVSFPGWPDISLGELAFVDTETSGLAGGTGTVAFNIGLITWAEGGWRSRQYLLTGFSGEAAMLLAVGEDLAPCYGVVTYNGGSFDLPLLRDRFRLQGVAQPPIPAAHLDLLHPVRRLFRERWADCRLATAESRLLGVERRDDLPGAEVPSVWFDWVRRGRGERLAAVLRHNRMDILSLVGLMPLLGAAAAQPERFGANMVAAARLWSKHDNEARALGILDQARQLDTEALHELARLRRRAGRLEEAVAVWERLAGQGCPHALEQLAKFHEHVRRDLRTALALADRLPACEARERRRSRLLRRCRPGDTLPLDL